MPSQDSTRPLRGAVLALGMIGRHHARLLGMVVTDTLTADLTFYRNGDVASKWEHTQSLRGVSEGDATRFALARREPLLVEPEAFCDLLSGVADPPVVSVAAGPETVVAEAALASAQAGKTVVLAEAPM